MNIPTRKWKAKVFYDQSFRISFHSKKLCGTPYNGPFPCTEVVQEMMGKTHQEALNEESIQMVHDRICVQIYHVPVFKCGNSKKQLLVKSSIYLLYNNSLTNRITAYACDYPHLIYNFSNLQKSGRIHTDIVQKSNFFL